MGTIIHWFRDCKAFKSENEDTFIPMKEKRNNAVTCPACLLIQKEKGGWLFTMEQAKILERL